MLSMLNIFIKVLFNDIGNGMIQRQSLGPTLEERKTDIFLGDIHEIMRDFHIY